MSYMLTPATSAFRMSSSHAIRMAAASTSFNMYDYMIIVTVTNQTITLPQAAAAKGERYSVKNGNIKNTTVVGPSGQTIDGKASYIVGNEYECAEFISEGANWLTC